MVVKAINKLSFTKRLIISVAGITTIAAVGSTGIAAAAPPSSDDGITTPEAVRICKCEHFLGRKNLGQCVSAFQHYIGHGNGKPSEY